MSMRQIKFRGKRTDEGGWIYGSLCNYLFDSENTTRPCIHIGNKGYIRNGFYEVYPSTIGQFTGLTDCNDKEIYEGDIVKACSEGAYKICEVAWSKGTVGFFLKHLSGPWYMSGAWGNESCEVIGNIHDTPELINQLTEV